MSKVTREHGNQMTIILLFAFRHIFDCYSWFSIAGGGGGYARREIAKSNFHLSSNTPLERTLVRFQVHVCFSYYNHIKLIFPDRMWLNFPLTVFTCC